MGAPMGPHSNPRTGHPAARQRQPHSSNMIQMPSSPRHSVKPAALESHGTDPIHHTTWGQHSYVNRARRRSVPDHLSSDSFTEYSRWKRGAMDIEAETSPIGRSSRVITPLEDWRRGSCPDSLEPPLQRKASRIAHAKTEVLGEVAEESLVEAMAAAPSAPTGRDSCGPKHLPESTGFAEYDRWKRGKLDIDAETASLGRSRSVSTPLESWRADCHIIDVADDVAVNEVTLLSPVKTVTPCQDGRKERSKASSKGFSEYDRWRRGHLDIDAETAPLGRGKKVSTPLESWNKGDHIPHFDTAPYHQVSLEAVA